MPGPGLSAYRKTMVITSSGRDLEANVLTKAAQYLKDCQARWGEEGHRERLDNALRVNQRVWSIIQAELASDDNPLPVQIRTDILSLSLFIDKRIIEIVVAPAAEKLSAIISINLNIAAGLRGSTSDEKGDTVQPTRRQPEAIKTDSPVPTPMYPRPLEPSGKNLTVA